MGLPISDRSSAGGDIKPSATTVRKPPTFPSAYEIKYLFVLPYVQVVQTTGLRIPVHVWYDGPSSSIRTDVFDGLDSTISTNGTTYAVYPRIHTKVCDASIDPFGPTNLLDAPLPDLSQGWSWGGSTTINNAPAQIWQYIIRVEEKINTYVFYVSDQGAPLKLHMMGRNPLVGSHFDEYLLEFSSFKAGRVAPEAFAIPKLCSGVTPSHSHATGRAERPSMATTSAAQAAALMPWGSIGHLGLARHQPGERSAHDLLHTKLANDQMVRLWDASAHGFSLKLNKFADWTHEQYKALMLGSRRPAGVSRHKPLRMMPRLLRKDQLPESVDWRGTGADALVKDQATCGSCWAFAATGTLQGAWYLATGESLSFSEQQLVDCSWKYKNEGCNGGWMEWGIQYVAEHGGIMSEEAYQYIGYNGFCSAKSSEAVAEFEGFMQVPTDDDEALMEAVYTHGPVAVSIDAMPTSFKFYSEGVYYDLACSTDPDELDHAVLLVGYGTAPDGHPYWLIRNSWSKFWGEDGYIRISRRHNCGVTVDPILAVVKESRRTLPQGKIRPQ